MTYDPTAAYRSAQVTTVSPAAQVVLLYEGAIRFSAQCIQRLQVGDLAAAHAASLRTQAIVSALRESLDLSQGPVATQLDSIYDFVLRRLVEGNVSKQAGPVVEAMDLLRGLLDAWRTIARTPAEPAARPSPVPAMPAASTSLAAYAGTRA